MGNELLNLRLINNTSTTIPSNLLGVTSTTTNTANATTRYTWNFSFTTLTAGSATIVINSVTTPVQFDGTIQGLANSLNNLNYGYFLVSGNTIYTQDDTNVYGDFTTPYSPLDPYISGSPQLVFDFSSPYYQNSGTTIADVSGNGNNGIFSTGTGNGTPTTVTGYSTNGYLNLPGTAAQLSVRLPDSLKPTGVVPFTYIVYMQPNGYGYLPNYPGIISDDSSVGSGVTFAVSPLITPPNPVLYAARNSFFDVPTLPFISGGGLGTWGVFAIKFDGTATTVYQFTSTNSGSATTVGATPIVSSPSWGLFLGLRYNNWINAKFNYVAMYNTALSNSTITNIANSLTSRVIV